MRGRSCISNEATLYAGTLRLAKRSVELGSNAEAKKLVDKGCDLIICLSHLGFEYGNAQISDKVLAANTENIHLILGGHTHTFLEKPFVAENLQKQPVLINQTGWAGLFLGRIDIDFEKGRFKQSTLSVI